MVSRKVVIYGAGGHARELRFQLLDAGIHVAAFVDDFHSDRTIEEVPVLNREKAIEIYPSAIWHLGFGDVAGRRSVFKFLLQAGCHIGSFVSPRAFIAPTAKILQPAQVFANSVVSAGVTVEENVIVNFGVVVSHDVVIGKHSYVSPGAHVAGNVKLGHSVWIGVGATIKNGQPEKPLIIGNNVVVGAGACVINDVEDNAVVIGVPAKAK